MKILVYSHDNYLSGATKAVFDLTNGLRQNNYEIIYAIPNHGKLEEVLINNRYEYVILPNPYWTIYARQPGYSRWYYLKYYIKSLLIFFKSIIGAYIMSVKAVKKINPDIIFVNTSVAPVGLYVAMHMKIKSILWVHETICNNEGACGASLFSRRYVGNIINKADLIIGPSNFIKCYIEEMFIVSNKMLILPNAIDYIPHMSNNSSTYKFGLVGGIHKGKGQVEFLAAMVKNMPEAKLIVYGAGENDYAKILYDMALKYPQNVKIYGYESDLNVIYSSFDIYVNMGVCETFGRTTVEAMRSGKLVFGRRSGATPEIIRHGENGFLFDNVDEVFAILKEYDTNEGHKQLQMIRERGGVDSLKYTPDKIIGLFNDILVGENRDN